jgi:signal transduction histidine kinase
VRWLVGLVAWVLPVLVARGAWGAAEADLQDGSQVGPHAGLHDGKNPLAAQAFVLEDEPGTLTLDDVRGPAEHRFRPLARGGENAGYSSSVYWLRFRVKNTTSSSSFILELSATPAIVELYDDAGTVRRSGASLPFGERDVAYSNIAFRIMLSLGDERTFWVRQRSSDTVLLDPVMWSEGAFWESRSAERLLNGLCYGVLIGLAVYNLFLFLGTRDRSYLLYVAFQVTNGLAQAALDKYTFQYLWPGHPAWAARSALAFGCLAMAAALAFARAFLDTRRLSPRLDAPMRVLCVAGVVLAVVWALVDQGALRALVGAHFLGSIAFIAVAATVAAARTGSTNARVFLVAWTVLLAGTAMAVLAALGIVVSLDGYRLMKLGSAVEAVLLSLALASRINELTRGRERAQREVLEAKTARIEALRQLVSGVAHEVGNPLNFARGGSDELAAQLDAIERTAPGEAASARRAHKLVASGLTRMKLILDNLRRYLSVGDAEPVTTDLAHEIDEALELTAERLASAGVRVEKQIGPLPALQARPGQLHQVMLNLIANAIEAMPGGGTLRVAARAGDHDVEVSMTDTGPGVDAADREKVFEPFFTTRGDTGGTGLGLAVAREIVMKDGGTIRVEDGDGGGARFVVSLPRLR